MATTASHSRDEPSAVDKPCYFLALPLELRLEIYSYLLSLPPDAPHEWRPPSQARPHVHAGLLLANRQINAEATPLLYARNTFVAHPTLLASFPRLRDWYAPVREAAVLARIRRFHMRLRLDCDVPFDRDTVAAAFSGLDELTIDLVQAFFMGVGCDNLTRFEAVRGVARVCIYGSTTGFEDYVSWLEAAMTSKPGSEVPSFVPSPSQPNWVHREALTC